MAGEIVIRQLSKMADLMATVDLQKAVWRMHDVEVSSPHTLRAIAHSGGVVLGAEQDGRLIGFCTGFAAIRDEEPMIWSHMACVHPDLQGRGIGLRLKQAQREWALAKGIRRMAWTFDPLQSGNANFNFNRLGVTARHYSPNHYGDMQDSINAGLASDRLEALWQLEAPTSTQPPDALTMVVLVKRGALRYRPPDAEGGGPFGIEIPADIAALKQTDLARAQAWQRHVRAAMTELLAAGYIVSGFTRQGDRGWYALTRER